MIKAVTLHRQNIPFARWIGDVYYNFQTSIFTMNENVTRVFLPDGGGLGNNAESLLLGSMMGGNGGFGGGMWNNPIWALVFLGIFANGNFFGGNRGNQCAQDLQLQAIREQLTSNQNSTLLMDAIKGNSGAIANLATNLNLTKDAVTCAINGVQQQICNLASQNGMNFMQVINSINSGNAAMANQLSSCCCEIKQETLKMGYENQINNLQQSNMIQKGFGDVAYATQAQTTALAANNDANTRAVLAKIDAVEDSRKDREISSLTAALTAANSRAERAAELAPIYSQLNEIKCKQADTITIPYSPVVGVPNCVAWNAALYGGGYPYSAQGRGSIWS